MKTNNNYHPRRPPMGDWIALAFWGFLTIAFFVKAVQYLTK